jgi:hypothetical protein
MYFTYLWVTGSREKVVVTGKHAWLNQHIKPSSGAWDMAEPSTLWPGQEGKHTDVLFSPILGDIKYTIILPFSKFYDSVIKIM